MISDSNGFLSEKFSYRSDQIGCMLIDSIMRNRLADENLGFRHSTTNSNFIHDIQNTNLHKNLFA